MSQLQRYDRVKFLGDSSWPVLSTVLQVGGIYEVGGAVKDPEVRVRVGSWARLLGSFVKLKQVLVPETAVEFISSGEQARQQAARFKNLTKLRNYINRHQAYASHPTYGEMSIIASTYQDILDIFKGFPKDHQQYFMKKIKLLEQVLNHYPLDPKIKLLEALKQIAQEGV